LPEIRYVVARGRFAQSDASERDRTGDRAGTGTNRAAFDERKTRTLANARNYSWFRYPDGSGASELRKFCPISNFFVDTFVDAGSGIRIDDISRLVMASRPQMRGGFCVETLHKGEWWGAMAKRMAPERKITRSSSSGCAKRGLHSASSRPTQNIRQGLYFRPPRTTFCESAVARARLEQRGFMATEKHQ
jgi:hypothetical protein